MSLSRSLRFIAIVIAALALLCIVFPKEGVEIAGITLRFPSLHRIIVKEHKPTLEDIMHTEAYQEHKKQLNGLADSIAFLQQQADSSSLRFWFPAGHADFFDPLFASMEHAVPEGRTVRIVHYGDSQIETDRMTQQLRTYMQQQFGGGGPGMQPSYQTIPSYAVSQWNSGDWTVLSSYGDSTVHRANGNYGLLARCGHLSGSGTVAFSASKQSFVDDRVRRFCDITVLFNNRPGPLTVSLSEADSDSRSQSSSNAGVHSFRWHLSAPISRLNLSLQGDADIYAILLDNGPGVAVDNVPLRGCSGQQFTMINRSQLQQAYSHLNVGLIILQFGGNSVPFLKGEKNTAAYAHSIAKQIDRMHEVCPSAKVLFIGPSDMSTMIDGELQSYRFLPRIVQMLRDTVVQHNAAYWSLYDAMGGHNSMVTWADNGLAGADYIHFSTKGVSIIGQRLADAFDHMYRLYLLRQRQTAMAADTSQFHADNTL